MKKASNPNRATSIEKKKKTKVIIALTYLLEKQLNQLDALSLYGDTCLNTTISELRNKLGFSIHGKLEPHEHQGGGITYFMRYRLHPECHQRAKDLIAKYD